MTPLKKTMSASEVGDYIANHPAGATIVSPYASEPTLLRIHSVAVDNADLDLGSATVTLFCSPWVG
jgi:hypothetical protein